MTHPSDNSAILKTTDEIRAYEYDRGAKSRDAEVAAHVQTIKELEEDLDLLQEQYDTHMKTHAPVDTTTPPAIDTTIIGMSSPATVWNQRVSEVGKEGLTARRIFAFLESDEQMNLVTEAVNDGLMPVYSFKINGITDSNYTSFATKIDTLFKKLNAYGRHMTVTFWHEPNPDITGALFVKVNEMVAPIADKYPNLSFGPFLNGWLLDNKVDVFTSYTSKKLLGGGPTGWRWVGIDTYESGTMEAPGRVKPADRIPKLVKFISDQGFPGKDLGIGEYNGYSAETIGACGEAILAEKTVKFGMMWNATTGKGYVLEGARLEAFKKTKADPRTAK